MSFGGRRPWPLSGAVVGVGVHEKWFEELAIISMVFEKWQSCCLGPSQPFTGPLTNMCIYTSVCLCACMSVCLYVYVSVCLCVYVPVCVYLYNVFVSMCMHIYVCVYMCVYVYVSVCLCVCVSICLYAMCLVCECKCLSV